MSFFISLFTGSVIVNAGILVAMLLLSESPILKVEPLNNFAQFLPFSYVNADEVLLSGSFWEPISNISITFSNGLTVLSVYSIILCVASFSIIFSKKKIWDSFQEDWFSALLRILNAIWLWSVPRKGKNWPNRNLISGKGDQRNLISNKSISPWIYWRIIPIKK